MCYKYVSVISWFQHTIYHQSSSMEKNRAKPMYVFIFFNWLLLSFFMGMARENATILPVKVGIILDLYGITGKMGLSCIKMSLSDFYESHSDYKTRIVLNIRNSHRDVVTAAAQGSLSISLIVYINLLLLFWIFFFNLCYVIRQW